MFSVKAQKLASELFVHQKSTKPRIQSEVLLVIKTEAVHCTSGQLYILKESYDWLKTKTIERCAGKERFSNFLAKNCFGPEESLIVGLLKNLRLTRNKETSVSWQSYKYLNWILAFLVRSTKKATKENRQFTLFSKVILKRYMVKELNQPGRGCWLSGSATEALSWSFDFGT